MRGDRFVLLSESVGNLSRWQCALRPASGSYDKPWDLQEPLLSLCGIPCLHCSIYLRFGVSRVRVVIWRRR